MNSNIALNLISDQHLIGQKGRIDEAIEFLIKENKKMVTQLDANKYQNLINKVLNLSKPQSTKLFSFSNDEILNSSLFHYYSLVGIFLRLKKLLKSGDTFDIISVIDEAIEKDLENFESFLIKPDFMNDELREETEQIYMYNSNKKGLIFSDRQIESVSSYENDEGFDRFLEKKKLYDVMTTYINSEVVFNFDNQDLIFNFQYLVNNYFNRIIEVYLEKHPELNQKLKFIYKGGTTMSILFMKYNELSNNMFSEYEDYFKRSDSD